MAAERIYEGRLNKEGRAVREFLIERANTIPNYTICYEDLCTECNLDFTVFWGINNTNKKLFKLLTNISQYEHDNGRPLLSAIVLPAGKKKQGKGFFKMCNNTPFDKNEPQMSIRTKAIAENSDMTDDKLFAEEMIARCQKYWRDAKNHDAHRKFPKEDREEHFIM